MTFIFFEGFDQLYSLSFKPGDKVRCVSGAAGTILTEGIYEIEEHKDGFVRVKGVPGGWMEDRFVLLDLDPPIFTLDVEC